MVNQQECLKSSVQKNSLVSKFICSSYENGPKDGFRDTNWTFNGSSLGRPVRSSSWTTDGTGLDQNSG